MQASGYTGNGAIHSSMPASVPGYGRVCQSRPGIDAAGQIHHLDETFVLKKAGCVQAADAMVADADHRSFAVDLVIPLGEFAEAPHTQRSYRKEVVRFHLWCRLQRQRDLAGITRADVQAWEGFLAAPPPEWIGPRHARLGSPGWRPFEGPLTAASRRQAAVILGGFYGYLQRCRYLDYNPFLVMRRRAAARTDAAATTRVLSREILERVLQVLGSRADEASDARRRDEAERRLFTVRFLVNAGLRRAELARARMSDLLQREDGDGRPAQWFLSVCGKGGRLRQVGHKHGRDIDTVLLQCSLR